LIDRNTIRNESKEEYKERFRIFSLLKERLAEEKNFSWYTPENGSIVTEFISNATYSTEMFKEKMIQVQKDINEEIENTGFEILFVLSFFLNPTKNNVFWRCF